MWRRGKIEAQVEVSIKHIVQENGILLEVALDVPILEDRNSAEDRANRLRRKMATIGLVNQVAKQEYETLKARRDFIAAQVEDLEGARKALSKIVAAIDRKMRNSFLETFEIVDGNFQEIFSTLFPGGHAHLTLADPDNPETTGVEVHAQPLGKKISKMTLMSGGEKSLTALALLFAVYRTRTVPFYVLDEVDDALDDANLRRPRWVSRFDALGISVPFRNASTSDDGSGRCSIRCFDASGWSLQSGEPET